MADNEKEYLKHIDKQIISDFKEWIDTPGSEHIKKMYIKGYLTFDDFLKSMNDHKIQLLMERNQAEREASDKGEMER